VVFGVFTIEFVGDDVVRCRPQKKEVNHVQD
jgi:hypothetical protein